MYSHFMLSNRISVCNLPLSANYTIFALKFRG
nr:MAG TPA: hypothetical protein [Caudoviricetes sp.]